MSYVNRRASPEDDHFFRVEVTVACCIATPENRVLGDNVVDVTFGFSVSMSRPPEGVDDEQTNAVLTHHISPVMAAIQATLTSMGFVALGVIDEPISERSSPTGEFGRATPVTVHIGGLGVPGIERPA